MSWGFAEPDEQVDVSRIYAELGGLPAVFAFSYLHRLEMEAPAVYARLEAWARPQRLLTWHLWPDERGPSRLDAPAGPVVQEGEEIPE